MKKDDIENMLAKNIQQAKFYNNPEKEKNIPTKIWAYFRNNIIAKGRRELSITQYVYDLHKEWLGNLVDKRVLDLGCLRGNALSLYLAENSKSYLGIDLSKEIKHLQDKLNQKNLKNARARVVDFLSDDFSREEKFDIIYIYGAMHHFEHFEAFLERVNYFLNEGGKVVSYDPMETNKMIYVARRLYRPFQKDADWEWPFNKESFNKIEKYFTIEQVQGVLGKSKLVFFYFLLPFSKKFRIKATQILHAYDIANANSINASLFNCMHVAMCLRKKENK
jgi:2-polyprenyl-3-methyl-5-hydroxy-6-metoxy-1,4-benzoquinol methylase